MNRIISSLASCQPIRVLQSRNGERNVFEQRRDQPEACKALRGHQLRDLRPHGIIAEHGFGTGTSGTLPFMVEPSGGLEWRVVYFDHMIIRVE
jgi:hypothetical protein